MKLKIYTVLIGLLSLITLFTACSNEGESIPHFEGKTIDGVEVNSNEWKGKVVVINVWATWCGTCIKEMPALNQLYEEYGNNPDVVFIAFTDESEEKTLRSLARYPFKYFQVADVEEYTSKLQTQLVKTYPQNLVVDKDGKIIFEVSDGVSDIYQDLVKVIEDTL
jgi:thiol-disulfide isomerase/thioredoxin